MLPYILSFLMTWNQPINSIPNPIIDDQIPQKTWDLTGNIRWIDGKETEQIPYAKLDLYQKNELIASTYTDVYGYYKFPDLQEDFYTVEVSYFGLPSHTQTDILLNAEYQERDIWIQKSRTHKTTVSCFEYGLLPDTIIGQVVDRRDQKEMEFVEVFLTMDLESYSHYGQTNTGGVYSATRIENAKNLPVWYKDCKIVFEKHSFSRTTIIPDSLAYQTAIRVDAVMDTFISDSATVVAYHIPLMNVENTAWQTLSAQDIRMIGQPSTAMIVPAYNHVEELKYDKAKINTASFQPKNLKMNQGLGERRTIHTSQSNLSSFPLWVGQSTYDNLISGLDDLKIAHPANIRVEELVNAFDYKLLHSQATGGDAFSYYTTLTDCPWNKERKLLSVNVNERTYNCDKAAKTHFIIISNVEEIDFNILFDELFVDMEETTMLTIIHVNKDTSYLYPQLTLEDKILRDSITSHARQPIFKSTLKGGNIAYQYAQSLQNDTVQTEIIFLNQLENPEDIITFGRDDNWKVLMKNQTDNAIDFNYWAVDNQRVEAMWDLVVAGNGFYAYGTDKIAKEKAFSRGFKIYPFVGLDDDLNSQIVFNTNVVKSYRLVGYDVYSSKSKNKEFQGIKPKEEPYKTTIFYEIELVDENDLNTNKNLAQILIDYKLIQENSDQQQEIDISTSYIPLSEANSDIQWAVGLATWGMLLRESKFYKDELTMNELYTLIQAFSTRYYDNQWERHRFYTLLDNFKPFFKEKYNLDQLPTNQN